MKIFISAIIIISIVLSFFIIPFCKKNVNNMLNFKKSNSIDKSNKLSDGNNTDSNKKGENDNLSTNKEKSVTELEKNNTSKKIDEIIFSSPKSLINNLISIIKNKDFSPSNVLLDQKLITVDNFNKIRDIVKFNNFQLLDNKPYYELSKSFNSSTWIINLVSPDLKKNSQIQITINKDLKYGFNISSVTEKTSKSGYNTETPLAIAELFAKAIIEKDVSKAKTFADLESLSLEKITALTIATEEGDYKLKKNRPYVITLKKDNSTWIITRLESTNNLDPSEFAMEISKIDSSFKVVSLTFSSLLQSISSKFNSSIKYTPIVKNPEGGDLVAIFFDFDDEKLSIRGQKQLKIISDILKKDSSRVIKINGHTDSLGTDSYNSKLGTNRASSVRDYFIKLGIPKSQIIIKSFGSSKPKLPNINPDGTDNPLGRSKNRRAEVFLDF